MARCRTTLDAALPPSDTVYRIQAPRQVQRTQLERPAIFSLPRVSLDLNLAVPDRGPGRNSATNHVSALLPYSLRFASGKRRGPHRPGTGRSRRDHRIPGPTKTLADMAARQGLPYPGECPPCFSGQGWPRERRPRRTPRSTRNPPAARTENEEPQCGPHDPSRPEPMAPRTGLPHHSGTIRRDRCQDPSNKSQLHPGPEGQSEKPWRGCGSFVA